MSSSFDNQRPEDHHHQQLVETFQVDENQNQNQQPHHHHHHHNFLSEIDRHLLRDVFIRIDENDGDGLISADDIIAFLDKFYYTNKAVTTTTTTNEANATNTSIMMMIPPSPEIIRKFVNEVADSDNDGYLNVFDFLAAHADGPGIVPLQVISTIAQRLVNKVEEEVRKSIIANNNNIGRTDQQDDQSSSALLLEPVIIVAPLTDGDIDELQISFKIHDIDEDGLLSNQELSDLIKAEEVLMIMAKSGNNNNKSHKNSNSSNTKPTTSSSSPATLAAAVNLAQFMIMAQEPSPTSLPVSIIHSLLVPLSIKLRNCIGDRTFDDVIVPAAVRFTKNFHQPNNNSARQAVASSALHSTVVSTLQRDGNVTDQTACQLIAASFVNEVELFSEEWWDMLSELQQQQALLKTITNNSNNNISNNNNNNNDNINNNSLTDYNLLFGSSAAAAAASSGNLNQHQDLQQPQQQTHHQSATSSSSSNHNNNQQIYAPFLQRIRNDLLRPEREADREMKQNLVKVMLNLHFSNNNNKNNTSDVNSKKKDTNNNNNTTITASSSSVPPERKGLVEFLNIQDVNNSNKQQCLQQTETDEVLINSILIINRGRTGGGTNRPPSDGCKDWLSSLQFCHTLFSRLRGFGRGDNNNNNSNIITMNDNNEEGEEEQAVLQLTDIDFLFFGAKTRKEKKKLALLYSSVYDKDEDGLLNFQEFVASLSASPRPLIEQSSLNLAQEYLSFLNSSEVAVLAPVITTFPSSADGFWSALQSYSSTLSILTQELLFLIATDGFCDDNPSDQQGSIVKFQSIMRADSSMMLNQLSSIITHKVVCLRNILRHTISEDEKSKSERVSHQYQQAILEASLTSDNNNSNNQGDSVNLAGSSTEDRWLVSSPLSSSKNKRQQSSTATTTATTTDYDNQQQHQNQNNRNININMNNMMPLSPSRRAFSMSSLSPGARCLSPSFVQESKSKNLFIKISLIDEVFRKLDVNRKEKLEPDVVIPLVTRNIVNSSSSSGMRFDLRLVQRIVSALFRSFDVDDDDKLSKKEFASCVAGPLSLLSFADLLAVRGSGSPLLASSATARASSQDRNNNNEPEKKSNNNNNNKAESTSTGTLLVSSNSSSAFNPTAKTLMAQEYGIDEGIFDFDSPEKDFQGFSSSSSSSSSVAGGSPSDVDENNNNNTRSLVEKEGSANSTSSGLFLDSKPPSRKPSVTQLKAMRRKSSVVAFDLTNQQQQINTNSKNNTSSNNEFDDANNNNNGDTATNNNDHNYNYDFQNNDDNTSYYDHNNATMTLQHQQHQQRQSAAAAAAATKNIFEPRSLSQSDLGYIHHLFHSLDTKKDGVIDLEELVASRSRQQQASCYSLLGDPKGNWSPEQLEAAAQRFLRHGDLDRDGVLNEYEFVMCFKRGLAKIPNAEETNNLSPLKRKKKSAGGRSGGGTSNNNKKKLQERPEGLIKKKQKDIIMSERNTNNDNATSTTPTELTATSTPPITNASSSPSSNAPKTTSTAPAVLSSNTPNNNKQERNAYSSSPSLSIASDDSNNSSNPSSSSRPTRRHNNNRKKPSPETIEQLRYLFSYIDRNRNGSISLTELEQLLKEFLATHFHNDAAKLHRFTENMMNEILRTKKIRQRLRESSLTSSVANTEQDEDDSASAGSHHSTPRTRHTNNNNTYDMNLIKTGTSAATSGHDLRVGTRFSSMVTNEESDLLTPIITDPNNNNSNGKDKDKVRINVSSTSPNTDDDDTHHHQHHHSLVAMNQATALHEDSGSIPQSDLSASQNINNGNQHQQQQQQQQQQGSSSSGTNSGGDELEFTFEQFVEAFERNPDLMRVSADAVRARIKRTQEELERMLQEEDLRKIAKVFVSLDADGNGVLDFDEVHDELFQLMSAQYPEWSTVDIERTVRSVFEAADINSDGELSFEEFISTFVNKHYSLTGFIDSSAARFKRDLTAEEVEELKSLFSFMDENNDGKISAEEIEKLVGSALVNSPQDDPATISAIVDGVFAIADANGDGYIDLREFIDAYQQDSQLLDIPIMAAAARREAAQRKMQDILCKHDLRDIAKVFLTLDKNGDGYLQDHELREAMEEQLKRLHPDWPKENVDEAIESVISAADVNHDGKLSLDEFIESFVQGHYLLPPSAVREVATDFNRQLSGSEVDQLVALFNTIDVNGDGTISRSELEQALTEAVGKETAEVIGNVIMTVADENLDGVLSINEFLKCYQLDNGLLTVPLSGMSVTTLTNVAERLIPKQGLRRLGRMFHMLDTKKDGFLDHEELAAGLIKYGFYDNNNNNNNDDNNSDRAVDDVARAKILSADIDGDGKLSLDEFIGSYATAGVNATSQLLPWYIVDDNCASPQSSSINGGNNRNTEVLLENDNNNNEDDTANNNGENNSSSASSRPLPPMQLPPSSSLSDTTQDNRRGSSTNNKNNNNNSSSSATTTTSLSKLRIDTNFLSPQQQTSSKKNRSRLSSGTSTPKSILSTSSDDDNNDKNGNNNNNNNKNNSFSNRSSDDAHDEPSSARSTATAQYIPSPHPASIIIMGSLSGEDNRPLFTPVPPPPPPSSSSSMQHNENNNNSNNIANTAAATKTSSVMNPRAKKYQQQDTTTSTSTSKLLHSPAPPASSSSSSLSPTSRERLRLQPEELDELQQQFKKYDKDKNGYLSLDEFKQCYKEMENYGMPITNRQIDMIFGPVANNIIIDGQRKMDFNGFCVVMLRRIRM